MDDPIQDSLSGRPRDLLMRLHDDCNHPWLQVHPHGGSPRTSSDGQGTEDPTKANTLVDAEDATGANAFGGRSSLRGDPHGGDPRTGPSILAYHKQAG